MQCPICLSRRYRVVAKKHTGYVEGTQFDIVACDKCDSQFIVNDTDKSIYDIIYSNDGNAGYDRYYRFAINIKQQSDPLKYLADQMATYFCVYKAISDGSLLDILDVGCGYGYLTYALRKAGHKTVGIDISKKAIAFAKKQFGDYFVTCDIIDYHPRKKYDLIIATELLEHLLRPIDAILALTKMLKTGGRIIITTPNKDFFNRSAIWRTDLPPVHTVWLGRKSIMELSKRTGLSHRFINLSRYFGRAENRLLDFVSSRLDNHPRAILDAKGIPKPRNNIVRMVCVIKPIWWLMNYFGRLLIRDHPALGIILTNK